MTPPGMMSRVSSNRGEFSGQTWFPPSEKMPQTPERKSDKQVRDNDPDVNELLIAKNLDGELETKGNGNETQKCQEKSPLQTGRENQRQRNQQPLEAKGEPKVLRHIRDGRMIYRVAPMKELRHLRSTAPGAEIRASGAARPRLRLPPGLTSALAGKTEGTTRLKPPLLLEIRRRRT